MQSASTNAQCSPNQQPVQRRSAIMSSFSSEILKPTPVTPPAAPLFTYNDACNVDMEVSREYDLQIDTQFVPLGVYTREVDYLDVSVQVGNDALLYYLQCICHCCSLRILRYR